MSELARFSLADPETATCPFGYYRAMQREAPVHRDPKLGMYLVTRYEDIAKALRDPVVFSREAGFAVQARRPWDDELDALMTREGYGPFQLATWDPPRHTKMRALMDKAFDVERVKAIEPVVAVLVDELIDALAPGETADWVARFAVPIPIFVIADALGIDRGRLDDFKRWSIAAVEPLGGLVSKEREFECAREMVALQHYLKSEIEARRERPRDDLISGLVHARLDDGSTLDLGELFSVIRAFLVAGNETTTNAIASGLLRLACDPALVDRMRSEADVERALFLLGEEVLRLESPVPGLPRMTTADVELGGVTIPKGSHVLLCYAAANRDEARFPEPERLDPGRRNAMQHLAFGSGIFRCIGATLARMEIKGALRAAIGRLDGLALAVPASELRYGPSLVTRGLLSLPLCYRARR
ncbi:MAG TPA: cytochrome P450 [Nevskiaceae bacterium]|nr:cytochrome P450 [Nevskiaceae bacterium]